MKSLAYIRFWMKSSNEHGIHSPFVFNWITQGLYSKKTSWDQLSPKEVFVERVFAYFKPNKVAWLSQKPIPENITSSAVFFSSLEAMRESTTSVQMIYLDETEVVTTVTLVEALIRMGNDAFILMDKRNSNADLNASWDDLLLNVKTTVTLDFYYFGLVFIRKEQLKQHFSIRL